MGSCIQSIFNLSATNDCLGWAVPLFLALASGMVWAGNRLWRIWRHTRYTNNNFTITIVNQLPPCLDVDPPSLRSIPLGGSDLTVSVACKYVFKVKRVDFRILNNDYTPGASPVGGFPATVEITQLDDIYDGGLAMSQRNGAGGMDGEYAVVRTLAANQGLYFRIRIEARKVNYRGLISFRAQNEEGERSVARYAFWIDPDEPVRDIAMRPMPTLTNPPPGWPVYSE